MIASQCRARGYYRCDYTMLNRLWDAYTKILSEQGALAEFRVGLALV